MERQHLEQCMAEDEASLGLYSYITSSKIPSIPQANGRSVHDEKMASVKFIHLSSEPASKAKNETSIDNAQCLENTSV